MRNGLTQCQCGGRAVYEAVRGDLRRAPRWRMRRAHRERIVCPACGNATSAGRGREPLREEWNCAGWCGQAEVGEINAEARRRGDAGGEA